MATPIGQLIHSSFAISKSGLMVRNDSMFTRRSSLRVKEFAFINWWLESPTTVNSLSATTSDILGGGTGFFIQ